MKLRATGLGQIVDGVFISDELGVPKPKKEFFEICFKTIFGTGDPNEEQRKNVLIIGDSLSSDMQGGLNVGIDTCWYRNSGEDNPGGLPVNFEIKHLREIFDIIYLK